MKLDKYVKDFYEDLANNHFTGCKCPRCGAVQFPPVYVCNECGNLETERFYISGKGTLENFILPDGYMDDIYFAAFKPYAHAVVTIAEGPSLNCIVTGITEENAPLIEEKLNKKEPVKVTARKLDRGDHSTLAFALAE